MLLEPGKDVVDLQVGGLDGVPQPVHAATCYTQVQGAVVLIALGYVLINLIIDLSYGWFDPRVRYE